jgi:5'-nucleotidase
MPFPIDDKLVVAIASSALFDLAESDRVYRERGEEEYRKYQREHEDDLLNPGVAFSFIRRLLSLNEEGQEDQPVEVILLSRNDPDTGLRDLLPENWAISDESPPGYDSRREDEPCGASASPRSRSSPS